MFLDDDAGSRASPGRAGATDGQQRSIGGRQRYLARQWDVEAYSSGLSGTEVATTFTDYLGEQPYVDYNATFDPNTEIVSTAEQRRYLAGFGVHADQDMTEEGGPATYHHGDLIRSTMLLTDESGAANQMVAYTAFGELVDGSGTIGYDPNAALPTRYQYAGGWGYESGVISLYGANPNLPPLTLQHVGARWYQPDIGRFVQRDPIGILGGMNCYAYCQSNPLGSVDPRGLFVLSPGMMKWILTAGGTAALGRVGAMAAGGTTAGAAAVGGTGVGLFVALGIYDIVGTVSCITETAGLMSDMYDWYDREMQNQREWNEHHPGPPRDNTIDWNIPPMTHVLQ